MDLYLLISVYNNLNIKSKWFGARRLYDARVNDVRIHMGTDGRWWFPEIFLEAWWTTELERQLNDGHTKTNQTFWNKSTKRRPHGALDGKWSALKSFIVQNWRAGNLPYTRWINKSGKHWRWNLRISRAENSERLKLLFHVTGGLKLLSSHNELLNSRQRQWSTYSDSIAEATGGAETYSNKRVGWLFV